MTTGPATTGAAGGWDDAIARQGNDGLGGDDAAHGVAAEHDAHRGLDGGRGGALGDLEVDDFFLQPVAEAGDAVGEVAAGFILGVNEDLDVEFGEEGGEVGAEILGEGVVLAKGLFTPLEVAHKLVPRYPSKNGR